MVYNHFFSLTAGTKECLQATICAVDLAIYTVYACECQLAYKWLVLEVRPIILFCLGLGVPVLGRYCSLYR
jgi:hypothetical protein